MFNQAFRVEIGLILALGARFRFYLLGTSRGLVYFATAEATLLVAGSSCSHVASCSIPYLFFVPSRILAMCCFRTFSIDHTLRYCIEQQVANKSTKPHRYSQSSIARQIQPIVSLRGKNIFI